MKMITCAALAAAALMIALTGCEDVSSDRPGKDSSLTSQTHQGNADETAHDTDSTDEASETESEKKPAHAAIGENGAKAVTDVLLIPHDDIDISHDVSFRDMYGVHALHSGVVGLVGAPIDVQFDTNEVEGGRLVFVYDPNGLMGVRPDALMFMWYDEANDYYKELENGVLNTENCSMSIEIEKPGVYLLVNKYAWLNAWGAGLADSGMEAGYDPSKEPISSELWKKNESVGDIPSLADEDYIADCRQDDGSYRFEVSDPCQLASAVYFVNCANESAAYDVTIVLMNDIDLEGYQWAPMGWATAGIDYDFTGIVIGNGHTIKNMNISSRSYAGFIGMGLYCTVSDLSFENAYVSGRNPGIVIGYARNSYISGCSVQGETSGSAAGAVVGIDQSSRISDCTADVICDGENISDFLAGNDRAAAQVSQQHGITEAISFDEMGRPCREAGLENKYNNICWQIMRDGNQVLQRNAKNETSLPWQDFDITSAPGHYSVTLIAFVDGYYIPISNTLEYDIP